MLIKEAKAGFPPCVFVILGQERKDGLEKIVFLVSVSSLAED